MCTHDITSDDGKYDCRPFCGDCYESVGKGGLAVCTSAEGAVDIVAGDDDC
jgi:hypothetical protein